MGENHEVRTALEGLFNEERETSCDAREEPGDCVTI